MHPFSPIYCRWHSLVVVHEHKRIRGSMVTVMLDNVVVASHALKYPSPKVVCNVVWAHNHVESTINVCRCS